MHIKTSNVNKVASNTLSVIQSIVFFVHFNKFDKNTLPNIFIKNCALYSIIRFSLLAIDARKNSVQSKDSTHLLVDVFINNYFWSDKTTQIHRWKCVEQSGAHYIWYEVVFDQRKMSMICRALLLMESK